MLMSNGILTGSGMSTHGITTKLASAKCIAVFVFCFLYHLF